MTQYTFYDQRLKTLSYSSRLKIGLFGGAFNPAHLGHKAVAETALKRLKLDQLWWLVSPDHPLKKNKDVI